MHDCCGEDEDGGGEGCAKVCKKCGGPWGSGASASGCHEREHNTVAVVEREEARGKPSGGLRRPRVSSPRNIALQLSDLVPRRKTTG